MASLNRIGDGSSNLLNDSTPISNAMAANTTALAKPPSTPIFPVPKLQLGSSDFCRA
jgi:hypothetical protein